MLQQELAEKLLELAMKTGAEASEVFHTRSHCRPVIFESNRLKQIENTQSEGIALRLWHNSRPGIAVAYGPVDPEAIVARAIAISQMNAPEIIELAEPYPNCDYPDHGQHIDFQQLGDWGKEAIALIRKDFPEVICHGEWDCEEEYTRLINSQGFDCCHRDTTLSGYIETELVRGDDFLNVGDGQTQRHHLNPEIIAHHILQRLEWAGDNVSLASQRMPVLFTAKAADILWGTVAAALNGKQVWEKSSPWSDRLGELVTHPLLTISQEPDIGPFSCPFDDEGTRTRSITFIDKGILQLFYTDRTTGRLLGSGTTGNGFRPGLGSYPSPELFNFLIHPGELSLNQLISQLDEGIIVDQILGGTAGISGDFSINVELGYRVKGGQVLGRVKDTMVAGNVYTAIKNIVALGNDADWNGAFSTPSVIVADLSITGKG